MSLLLQMTPAIIVLGGGMILASLAFFAELWASQAETKRLEA